MQHLKPGPTGWLIVLVVVIGAVTWQRSGSGVTLMRRLVLPPVAWLAIMVAAYTVFVAIAPPVDDDGHHFMPFGQVMAAFAVASAAAPGALVALYRPLRTNPAEESTMIAICSVLAIAGRAAKLAGVW